MSSLLVRNSLIAQCTPYDASGNQLLLRRTWHPSPNIYLSGLMRL
ncbi:hypothetical protein M758_12G137800 [Ceratodon purpureus]|nr:hypothetical protein M758_12G137800 [Ceratodon purpureus]